ncbi:IS1096 element passenger TnpR family protein [Carboxylicivirga linearis]|uniref:Plasmid pRiA4b Orf3-like domain-containing protein n=1 Tax=Carboxylicivirga linearis TaxID=1628157 RepID=A0ABS5K1F1_9BACT|nr:hypothetical protein [Carboxylicivirga linearis]MBS2100997.1 hypothetical protein [Carboxylicivirga linearis]
MIIYLRLLSDEKDDFVKEIAVDDKLSFADLHSFIQELLKYDASQMASFFTTDKDWNKETEITLFDMADFEAANLRTMQDTVLTEYLYEIGQRMLYVFDFFSERAFFMEVIKTADGNLDKPMCYRNDGENPDQIQMVDLSEKPSEEHMNYHEDEFDGSLDSLDFSSLDDIDLENEGSDFY